MIKGSLVVTIYFIFVARIILKVTNNQHLSNQWISKKRGFMHEKSGKTWPHLSQDNISL